MNPLADQHLYLADQSEDQRASDYPYAAPEGAYVLDHGRLLQLSDASVLEGRVAVLSVGSNRAPVQLRRKFGNKALVPVTPLILHDCDVVHAAAISYYGAVSCTAFPSRGTDVMLNAAWLDPDQLQVMHRTEALGVAYDYVRLFTGVVTHLPVLEAGGEIVAPTQPVFGYAARRGVLDVGGGYPAGLDRIPARNRRFQTFSQASAAALVHTLAGSGEPTVDGFVARVVEDRGFRRKVNDDLQARAVHGEGPWKIQDAESVDIRDFL